MRLGVPHHLLKAALSIFVGVSLRIAANGRPFLSALAGCN
jgi:hypothetical protein